MDISYIAIDRILTDKAASDRKYERLLRAKGKVLLKDGRALSDDALLAKLCSLGLALDRDEFADLARPYLSAQEWAKAVYKEFGAKIREDDQDWVWIALVCLWERWLPQRPSLEMIDDFMQAGYKAEQGGDRAKACRLWRDAWQAIWNIIETRQLRSLDEFDALFQGTQCVFNWIQDYVWGLHEAGLDDSSFISERIALCQALLQHLELDELLGSNLKGGLAESYFDAGQPDEGEHLFRTWLQEEPTWGWGWLHWSDCYGLPCRRDSDPAKAEAILRQGLAVPRVTEREELLDRLATVCEETGRKSEAAALRGQLRVKGDVGIPAAMEEGNRRNPRTQRGGTGISQGPTAQRSSTTRKRDDAWRAKEKNVGRNDPCPCGSGQKFKRCCGRRP